MKELMLIQQELKAPKGQYNSFGKYRYRSCEDILEAVKPLLTKHGCILSLTDDIMEAGGRIYVKATATIIKVDDGTCFTTTAFAREEERKSGMDAAQITGSASSYARKYALNGMFCIDDTKDADTDEQHKQAAAAQAKAAKPAKPEPPKLTQEEQDDFELAKADIRNATTLEAITDIMLARKGVAYYSELRKIAAEKSKSL